MKRKTLREQLLRAIKRQFGLDLDDTVPDPLHSMMAGYVVGWKTGYRAGKREGKAMKDCGWGKP